MFIGRYNYASLVTYLGVVFAVFGIYAALITENIDYAMLFLVLSGICDMFDGFVARLIKQDEEEKLFGVQIDSLADTVNFVVFPVIITVALGVPSVYAVAIYAFYIIAGITRLAYFNVTVATAETRPKGYVGMPVTFSALLFPVMYLIGEKIGYNLLTLTCLIQGLLFIIRIPIPKPRGKAYVFFTLLGIGLTALFTYKGMK